jgi:hypothetical protein
MTPTDASAVGRRRSAIGSPGPADSRRPTHRFPYLTAILLSAAIAGLSIHNKLTANLYSENFNIARALAAGRGFADAVGEPTGPTAWNAPTYPLIQAFLLRLGGGSRDVVMTGLACLHALTLVGTGWLVLAAAGYTTRRIGPVLTAVIFLLALLYHFSFWFQVAQDCWLMLLMLDLLIAGCFWFGPLDSWKRAVGWGLFGGICAMANPAIAFTWGILTLVLGLGTRFRTAVAIVVAAVVLSPWMIRNYVVFGRLIPVKSNLAFELYQSQCLQPDGLMQATAAATHPSTPGSRERQEYRKLGEIAYLDRKWQQFCDAVADDPGNFVDRVASRFLGATVWYVPHNRPQEARRPWLLWLKRFTHPLPFLALVFLIYSGIFRPLGWTQWTVIGVYLLYLTPYVAASYYERYTVPLVGVKVLLVIWAVDRFVDSLGAASQ